MIDHEPYEAQDEGRSGWCYEQEIKRLKAEVARLQGEVERLKAEGAEFAFRTGEITGMVIGQRDRLRGALETCRDALDPTQSWSAEVAHEAYAQARAALAATGPGGGDNAEKL